MCPSRPAASLSQPGCRHQTGLPVRHHTMCGDNTATMHGELTRQDEASMLAVGWRETKAITAAIQLLRPCVAVHLLATSVALALLVHRHSGHTRHSYHTKRRHEAN